MMSKNKLHIIGYGSGMAGVHVSSGDGPKTIQKSVYLPEIEKNHIEC